MTCSALAASSPELEILINSGRSAEAYRRGTTEPKPGGDAQFDYFLGVASVDSGKVAEGVAYLQAYVIANPSDMRGHLELGRARFLLGDNEAAKREFELVKAFGPPVEVAANIDVYLQAIAARLATGGSPQQTSVVGYLEAGVGHDSNINGGVSTASLNLPVAGAVTVDQTGVKRSAPFARFAGSLQGAKAIAESVSIFAGANLDGRFHGHGESFNNLYGIAQAGIAVGSQRQSVRLSGNYSTFVLDRSTYRTSPSLLVEWQAVITDAFTTFASLQSGRLAYQGPNFVRDANFTNFTAGLRGVFGSAWRPTLLFTANVGRERNVRDRDDLSRNSEGGRLGAELTPSHNLQLSAGYSEQASRYVAEDLFFALSRHDKYKGLDLGANYAVSAAWSIRAELFIAETKSNIELFSNRRFVGIVGLRYLF